MATLPAGRALPAEHKKSHCATRPRTGGQRGRKGWSGKAALSLSHGPERLPQRAGPLSIACPAPRLAGPRPCQHSAPANGPPRGAPTPTAGAERAEAQAWETCCCQASTHRGTTSRAGQGQGLVHKQGVGTQPLGLRKQNRRSPKGGPSERARTQVGAASGSGPDHGPLHAAVRLTTRCLCCLGFT